MWIRLPEHAEEEGIRGGSNGNLNLTFGGCIPQRMRKEISVPHEKSRTPIFSVSSLSKWETHFQFHVLCTHSLTLSLLDLSHKHKFVCDSVSSL